MLAPGLNQEGAPSWTVPVRHFASGMIYFVAALVTCVLHPGVLFTSAYLQPHTVAVVHLVTLGWLVPVMMGAQYQFLPVILQRGLYSEWLAKAGWYFNAFGTLVFASGIWNWWEGAILVGAALEATSLLLFAFNSGVILWRGRPLGLAARFIAAGWLFLLATPAFGLLLAINSVAPFLPAQGLATHLVMHVLAAAVGWLTLTAIGVSYHLLPLFALSPRVDKLGWRTLDGAIPRLVLIVFPSSLLLLLIADGWPGNPLTVVAGTVLVLTTATAAIHLLTLVGRRLKRQLDPGISFSGWAIAHLAGICLVTCAAFLIAIQGAAVDWPRWLMAAGVWFFFGWLSGLMWSQLYKIVPFIMWLHCYGGVLGRQSVPKTSDLVAPERDRYVMLVYTLAVPALALGVLLGNTSAGRIVGFIALVLLALSSLYQALRLLVTVTNNRQPAEANLTAGAR